MSSADTLRKISSSRGGKPNLLQRALMWRYSPLTQTSSIHASVTKLLNRGNTQCPTVTEIRTARAMQAIDYAFPWVGKPPPSPLSCERVSEYNLVVDLHHVLGCRVREGFFIDDGGINIGLLSGTRPRGSAQEEQIAEVLEESTASRENGSGQTGSRFCLALKMKWQPEVDIRYIITEPPLALAKRTRRNDTRRFSTEINGASGEEKSYRDETTGTGGTNAGMLLNISIEIIAAIGFLRKFKEAARIVSFQKSSKIRSRGERKKRSSRKPQNDKKMEALKKTSPFLLHHLLSSLHEIDKVLMHLSSPSSSPGVTTSSVDVHQSTRDDMAGAEATNDANLLGGRANTKGGCSLLSARLECFATH